MRISFTFFPLPMLIYSLQAGSDIINITYTGGKFFLL